MNAVMNLWVSFSGRTPLCEVSFFPLQEILLRSVCFCCQAVGIRHFFNVLGKFQNMLIQMSLNFRAVEETCC